MNFSDEEKAKLRSLLTERYIALRFPSSLSVSGYEVNASDKSWFAYLKRLGIKRDWELESEEFGFVEGYVEIHVQKNVVYSRRFFIPEDLALKVLVLGEFPPTIEEDRDQALEFSRN